MKNGLLRTHVPSRTSGKGQGTIPENGKLRMTNPLTPSPRKQIRALPLSVGHRENPLPQLSIPALTTGRDIQEAGGWSSNQLHGCTSSFPVNALAHGGWRLVRPDGQELPASKLHRRRPGLIPNGCSVYEQSFLNDTDTNRKRVARTSKYACRTFSFST